MCLLVTRSDGFSWVALYWKFSSQITWGGAKLSVWNSFSLMLVGKAQPAKGTFTDVCAEEGQVPGTRGQEGLWQSHSTDTALLLCQGCCNGPLWSQGQPQKGPAEPPGAALQGLLGWGGRHSPSQQGCAETSSAPFLGTNPECIWAAREDGKQVIGWSRVAMSAPG